MAVPPTLYATDLEGVLVPEIWIAFAEATGIAELRLTTRDEPDYDKLMHYRLDILRRCGLTLANIQAVIDTLQPLPGAVEYLAWVRAQAPCIILSDTFYEFAAPLMAKLGHPTLFCNTLEVGPDNMLAGYTLRRPDGKRHAVEAFKRLGFRVVAVGDSYNDTTMLGAADAGILFRAPDKVVAEFPQFPVRYEYAELQAAVAPLLGAAG